MCPLVADGEDSFQIWRVAANILNNHLLRADNRWSSMGNGLRTPNHKK